MESDLQFFVLLAHHENFTKTGREIGISASAVSRRLARLEDRLGVRLLNRTTRRVSLTSEGEIFLNEAAGILSDIETLEQRISGARESPTGRLRINSTLRFGRMYVAPAISSFKRLYPEVDVQLILSDAPLNLVEAGVDVAVRFGVPPDSHLISRLLLRNRRFLCASPKYLERTETPRSIEDLQHHNCIVLRQDHGTYDLWRFDDLNGDAPSVKVSGDLSTNDGEVALDWVIDGHGIMMRSEWDIARRVRSGELTIVLPTYKQAAHVFAIYPERHNLSAKVRKFIDHLGETLNDTDVTQGLILQRDEIAPSPTQ